MIDPTKLISTYLNVWRNRTKTNRMLEIGPGPNKIAGFETLDIVGKNGADYTWDAAKRLPFRNDTFSLIYASHVLEHIAWYRSEETLLEWVRVLKSGGRLEIWVPDGLKVCKALIDYELNDDNYTAKDGWYRYNPEKNPWKWASGRIFTYGDGTGKSDHPNWHRALFTGRYLGFLLKRVGLRDIRKMDSNEVRGYDHGWINLGATGTK